MAASLGIARGILGIGRRIARHLSPEFKKRLEDRAFYTVFHMTRVTNDAYGWRPKATPPEGGAPNPDEPSQTDPPERPSFADDAKVGSDSAASTPGRPSGSGC